LGVWILRLGNWELASGIDPRLIVTAMAIVKKILSAIFSDQIMTERGDKIVGVSKRVVVTKKNMVSYYVLHDF
jgi:hypothetical protein